MASLSSSNMILCCLRVTLLNKIDLVSVSNMMDRVYRSIVQMTRASWHDSWEDRMEVVENLCEKLQVILDESMKLVLQQKTDFEHVFQLFELILSKIEAMKKIEMRGSITDDFGCHHWKDMNGVGQNGFLKQIFYLWYLSLKEAKRNQVPSVGHWTQVAIKYDAGGTIATFMQQDETKDESVAKMLLDQRLSAFLQNPSIQSYEKALASCSSDQEKQETSDEMIKLLEPKATTDDTRFLLLQLYAKTNRDIVSLCDRFDDAGSQNDATPLDHWKTKEKQRSRRYMLTCEAVINTDPEYVFQTSRKMLLAICQAIPRMLVKNGLNTSSDFFDTIPDRKKDRDEFDEWFIDYSYGEFGEFDSTIMEDFKLWLQYAKMVCHAHQTAEQYELKFVKGNVPTLIPDGSQIFDQLVQECEQTLRKNTDDKLMKNIPAISLVWGGSIFRPLEAIYKADKRKKKKHSSDIIGFREYVDHYTREFYQLKSYW